MEFFNDFSEKTWMTHFPRKFEEKLEIKLSIYLFIYLFIIIIFAMREMEIKSYKNVVGFFFDPLYCSLVVVGE